MAFQRMGSGSSGGTLPSTGVYCVASGNITCSATVDDGIYIASLDFYTPHFVIGTTYGAMSHPTFYRNFSIGVIKNGVFTKIFSYNYNGTEYITMTYNSGNLTATYNIESSGIVVICKLV